MERFGTSVFTEVNLLAAATGSVNLSQGAPDFPGCPAAKEAARAAIAEDHNQYAPSPGVPALRQAISRFVKRRHGVEYDPDTEITVTSGATEGIAAAILGLLSPGDSAILVEPCYDSYWPCVTLASATATFVTLEPPAFRLTEEKLEAAVTPRTRLIVVNTPHNPTGHVMDLEEIEAVARVAERHDLVVLSDEVYEYLVFAPAKHVPLASVGRLRERTVTLSSFAKSLSLTGWKVGYVQANPELSKAVRRAHQFFTFSSATPLQTGIARVLDEIDPYLDDALATYTRRRDLLVSALREARFDVFVPEGTYFAMVDHSRYGFADDWSFVRALAHECKIAAIPPSSFYERPETGAKLARFSFCKTFETLERAAERLRAVPDRLTVPPPRATAAGNR